MKAAAHSKAKSKHGNVKKTKTTGLALISSKKKEQQAAQGLIALYGPSVSKFVQRRWSPSNAPLPESRLTRWFHQCMYLMVATIRELRDLLFKIPLLLIHYGAKKLNMPLVDIGRDYSVSEMNDRLGMLEQAVVRQWTGLNSADFSLPSEEIRQYIAACHVARQYDRINMEVLARRLDISYAKSADLITRMINDGVITEGYQQTYHDSIKSIIDDVVVIHAEKLH